MSEIHNQLNVISHSESARNKNITSSITWPVFTENQ